MPNDDIDMLDFGDDDDEVTQDFLTSKLAALGIDEDLELSGGEENEDPGVVAKAVEPARPRSGSPGKQCGAMVVEDYIRKGEKGEPVPAENGDEHVHSLTAAATAAATVAAATAEAEAGVEEGELISMLNKPLQASRDRPQSRCEASRGSDGAGGERSRRRGGKGRLKQRNGESNRPKVTIKECAKWVCQRLEEPKYYLMCRVVSLIGYNNSKRLLGEVQRIQENGGMPTADGTRKRTPGGVFFTLLKDHVKPAVLKEMYADEMRVKKEKERMRRTALKRKAEAADAGENVVMPPRNPPRRRGISTTWRGAEARDDVISTKRAREDKTLKGEEREVVSAGR